MNAPAEQSQALSPRTNADGFGVAARALLVGEPALAVQAVAGWRFSDDGAVTLRLLAAMAASPPHPMVCGEISPAGRVAWGLASLARAADHARARSEAALRRKGLRPSEDDLQVRGLWARWFDGGAWTIQAAWEDRFLGDARSAFKAVLVTTGLDAPMGRRVLEELSEWFFFELLAEEDGVPGWADLAARLLETDPTPDTTRVATTLTARGWGTVGRCMSRRGTYPATAGLLVPEADGTAERALLLSTWLGSNPQALPLSTDLHLARRLIQSWNRPERRAEEQDLRVLSQNRGRVMARLRAVLQRAERAALRRAVLDLDCLAARTHEAVRRYALDHARRQVASHFALRARGSPTPPCSDTAGFDPLTLDDLPALRTWVALAVLRGCRDQLRLWATPGCRAETGGTWGRLLTRELPEALADPPAERRRTYHRLRAALSGQRDALLRDAMPVVRAVAGLSPPFTRAGFLLAVSNVWHPDVRIPLGGYAALVRRARAAVGAAGEESAQ